MKENVTKVSAAFSQEASLFREREDVGMRLFNDATQFKG